MVTKIAILVRLRSELDRCDRSDMPDASMVPQGCLRFLGGSILEVFGRQSGSRLQISDLKYAQVST